MPYPTSRKRSIGTNPVLGSRYPSGLGYVFLPEDSDRETYIQNCYRTGRVSIVTQNSEFLHRVPVGRLTIQFIEFPQDTETLGSPVLWINDVVHNQPLITDVFHFNDEYTNLEEGDFSLRKELEGNLVEIAGRSKRGDIDVNASSIGSIGGNINVTSSNDNKTSIITLSSSGSVVEIANSILNQANGEIKITSIDTENGESGENTSTITINNGEIKVDSALINHNEGSEPMVLGQTLVDLLNDILQEISNITVSTALGQMPIINKVAFELFQNQTDSILSQISNLD